MKKFAVTALLAFAIGMIPRPQDNRLEATPTIRYTRVGQASWYSRHDPGINKFTANNEIFDDRNMTCAMWGVAFDREIKATNLANGKSVIVRVNDRGPHVRFIRQGRIIDLTKAAFELIADSDQGLIPVELEFL